MVPTGNITQKYEAVSTASTDIPPFVEAEVSKIFRIVVFSLVTIASLLGNIVVCNAVYNQGHRKTLSYLLVANLAVAEIISTLCLPFVFVYEYMGKWPFGRVGCTLIIPLQVASMFVVTSTLAVIAVYRYYFIVVQPLDTLSPRIAKAILVLLWVIPFLFCLPIFMYNKLFDQEDGTVKCYPIFPGDDFGTMVMGNISNSYNIARFVFNFIAPCLVMILAYGAVACKLKRYVRRTRETSIELSQVGQVAAIAQVQSSPDKVYLQEENGTREDPQNAALRIIELENNLVRMFYLVIIIFLVFYIPYQVFFMYIHFGGTWSDYLYLYLDLFSSLPSALHPLCYGTMSSFFAMSFRKLVLCKK